jgi:hypothetical protein
VEKLEDCETLTNADVMQIFKLYGSTAPKVIKGLVPKLLDCSDKAIQEKYDRKSWKRSLVNRQKNEWREKSQQAFKDEKFVRRYFPNVLPSMQDENRPPAKEGPNDAEVVHEEKACSAMNIPGPTSEHKQHPKVKAVVSGGERACVDELLTSSVLNENSARAPA